MGHLPYQIAANWRKSDGADVLRAIKIAIKNAHGVHVRIGSSEQNRYPTLEHAAEAYRELSAALPGPYWVIVKDGGAAE